jgi:hypothetical protein
MQSRQTAKLTAAECWRLLGSVPLGKIVFTRRAMRAIRPASHLVDDGIIIRSQLGAPVVALDGAGDDPVRHTRWSLIAAGTVRLVRDPAAVARYEQMLEPWSDRQTDELITVKPQAIAGLRLDGRCR